MCIPLSKGSICTHLIKELLTDKTQLMGSFKASLMLRKYTKLHIRVVMKLVTATKTNHVEYQGEANAMHRMPRT